MLNDDEQEKIVKHYAKHFHVKADDMVYLPEEPKDGRKIDLFWIKPRKNYPFHTLATLGISDYRIDGGENEYIELIMVLPESWEISKEDGEYSWQVDFLKKVAHKIQDKNLPIQYGSLILDSEDMKPFESDTNMCCGLVVLPETYPTQIFKLKKEKDKYIKFYALTTLTKSEYERAISKDIFDFIDDDLATEDGTDIFVVEKREPKRREITPLPKIGESTKIEKSVKKVAKTPVSGTVVKTTKKGVQKTIIKKNK